MQDKSKICTKLKQTHQLLVKKNDYRELFSN